MRRGVVSVVAAVVAWAGGPVLGGLVPGRTDPLPAGDVGMLAYAGVRDDGRGWRTEIFTIHTDGSDRRQLTTTGGSGPEWSPDGSQIAYDARDRVRVMAADGSGQRTVADGEDPSWSPDGTRLAYRRPDGSLAVLDLRSGVETVVVPGTEAWPEADKPDWSPDGAWIALARTTSLGDDDYAQDRQLFLVRPDGTGLQAVPHTEPLADAPAWSPDGATLLYTERYDGRNGETTGDVWSIRPDGSGRTPILTTGGRDDDVAWSPDGSRVALLSAGSLYPDQDGVWTMDPDGTDRTLVVRGAGQPSWRPGYAAPPAAPPPPPTPPPATGGTGPRIAYVASTDEGYDLFTTRPDGTRTRRHTRHGAAWLPTWSPDHKRIAFLAGVRSLWVLDVRTDRSRRVARPYAVGGLAWSPSGRHLAWARSKRIVILDLRSGERRRVSTGGACCIEDLAWSPDGRWLALTRPTSYARSVLLTVPAAGGPARVVTRMAGLERDPDWSPDGRRIVFAQSRGRWWHQSADVRSVRPDGTGLRTELRTGGLDDDAAWSPDGRRIALYSDGPRPLGAEPRPGLWTVRPGGGDRALVVPGRAIAYVDW